MSRDRNVLQGLGSGSGRGEGMLGVGTGFKTEEEVRCGPERFKEADVGDLDFSINPQAFSAQRMDC